MRMEKLLPSTTFSGATYSNSKHQTDHGSVHLKQRHRNICESSLPDWKSIDYELSARHQADWVSAHRLKARTVQSVRGQASTSCVCGVLISRLERITTGGWRFVCICWNRRSSVQSVSTRAIRGVPTCKFQEIHADIVAIIGCTRALVRAYVHMCT